MVLLDLDVPAGAEASTEAVMLRVAQLVRFGVEPGGVSVGETRRVLLDGTTVDEFVAACATAAAALRGA